MNLIKGTIGLLLGPAILIAGAEATAFGKTPTDVYNNLLVVAAHIEEIKAARKIEHSETSPPLEKDKTPADVFGNVLAMLTVVGEIQGKLKIRQVTIGAMPAQTGPDEVYAMTSRVLDALKSIRSALKMPSGLQKKMIPIKDEKTPPDNYAESIRLLGELRVLLEKL